MYVEEVGGVDNYIKSKNLKDRGHLVNPNLGGNVILKCILYKRRERVDWIYLA
jgi:hypothetical protein